MIAKVLDESGSLFSYKNRNDFLSILKKLGKTKRISSDLFAEAYLMLDIQGMKGYAPKVFIMKEEEEKAHIIVLGLVPQRMNAMLVATWFTCKSGKIEFAGRSLSMVVPRTNEKFLMGLMKMAEAKLRSCRSEDDLGRFLSYSEIFR